MSVKLYQLYCEICNWKRITDGSDHGLREAKSSPIQRGVPKLGEEKDTTLERGFKSREIIEPKMKKLPKRFKCPKCGRIVRMKKIKNPQATLNDRLDEMMREERMKTAELEAQDVLDQKVEETKHEREKSGKKDWLDGREASP